VKWKPIWLSPRVQKRRSGRKRRRSRGGRLGRDRAFKVLYTSGRTKEEDDI